MCGTHQDGALQPQAGIEKQLLEEVKLLPALPPHGLGGDLQGGVSRRAGGVTGSSLNQREYVPSRPQRPGHVHGMNLPLRQFSCVVYARGHADEACPLRGGLPP
jgi:hypothetical protein